jgi:hypothetical protein
MQTPVSKSWFGPLLIAKIFNRPYRRFSTCCRHEVSRALPNANTAPVSDSADCKSAIQQIENLRYVP